jgi:hypothetical protein
MAENGMRRTPERHHSGGGHGSKSLFPDHSIHFSLGVSAASRNSGHPKQHNSLSLEAQQH